jgi:hypothetical protein
MKEKDALSTFVDSDIADSSALCSSLFPVWCVRRFRGFRLPSSGVYSLESIRSFAPRRSVRDSHSPSRGAHQSQVAMVCPSVVVSVLAALC